MANGSHPLRSPHPTAGGSAASGAFDGSARSTASSARPACERTAAAPSRRLHLSGFVGHRRRPLRSQAGRFARSACWRTGERPHIAQPTNPTLAQRRAGRTELPAGAGAANSRYPSAPWQFGSDARPGNKSSGMQTAGMRGKMIAVGRANGANDLRDNRRVARPPHTLELERKAGCGFLR